MGLRIFRQHSGQISCYSVKMGFYEESYPVDALGDEYSTYPPTGYTLKVCSDPATRSIKLEWRGATKR
jgi:hypothetical protein